MADTLWYSDSGTNWQPKGVEISHTLIIQSLAKIAMKMTTGTSVPYRRDLLMHGYPGGRRLPCPATEFDAKSAFDAIKDQGVTSFITVPVIMAGLLSYDRAGGRSVLAGDHIVKRPCGQWAEAL
ncbi:unnamed protein product [Miscanthus lutarioriparius]|uniref:Uncharacterized protein n=1 Tax=Miscanthus lutarioriparius TaxID=422564 RepID=A0A811NU51_9POAL|nr:unnamed protein product [Miscanthus lutarioriparius]